MSDISKGIVCRICTHNQNGICAQGSKSKADKKDECWKFKDRNKHSGMAEYSDNNPDWSN